MSNNRQTPKKVIPIIPNDEKAIMTAIERREDNARPSEYKTTKISATFLQVTHFSG